MPELVDQALEEQRLVGIERVRVHGIDDELEPPRGRPHVDSPENPDRRPFPEVERHALTGEIADGRGPGTCEEGAVYRSLDRIVEWRALDELEVEMPPGVKARLSRDL